MKIDIILAGVGGQGILSIAAIIGSATVSKGLYMKQAEVHGMSQRGGDVQSHLRISDKPIFSDLIPLGQADLILAVEPMEALRYLPYLSKEGWVVTNKTPFINIGNYPEPEIIWKKIETIKNHKIIDADLIAKELGNTRGMNMVVLGAASDYIGLSKEELTKAINDVFGRKGEDIVKANLAAIEAGYEAAKKYS